MNRFEWLIENDREFLLWLAQGSGSCTHCIYQKECMGLEHDPDVCERGCREWLLADNDGKESDVLIHTMPHYLYALSHMKKMINELISANDELERQLRISHKNELRLAQTIDMLTSQNHNI